MSTTPLIDFGLDPMPGAELHEVCAALRESQRVAPARFYGTDAVLFTRFEDVRDAFRDDAKFPGGDFYEASIEPVVGRTFISMNGREHDLHRKLATPAFRSRAVARFDEEALVPLANEVVDRFASKGEGDLFAELCVVLPFAAITRKLGVPKKADEDMRRWADTMLSYPSDPYGAVEAAKEFSEQLEPLLEERRERPGDDLLSELAAAEMGGETLTDDEVCSPSAPPPPRTRWATCCGHCCSDRSCSRRRAPTRHCAPVWCTSCCDGRAHWAPCRGSRRRTLGLPASTSRPGRRCCSGLHRPTATRAS